MKKYFVLFFLCFMLCGCRTFTDLEFNQHLDYAYNVGYKDGYKEGTFYGKISGNIECMDVSLIECSKFFRENVSILETFLETGNHQ